MTSKKKISAQFYRELFDHYNNYAMFKETVKTFTNLATQSNCKDLKLAPEHTNLKLGERNNLIRTYLTVSEAFRNIGDFSSEAQMYANIRELLGDRKKETAEENLSEVSLASSSLLLSKVPLENIPKVPFIFVATYVFQLEAREEFAEICKIFNSHKFKFCKQFGNVRGIQKNLGISLDFSSNVPTSVFESPTFHIYHFVRFYAVVVRSFLATGQIDAAKNLKDSILLHVKNSKTQEYKSEFVKQLGRISIQVVEPAEKDSETSDGDDASAETADALSVYEKAVELASRGKAMPSSLERVCNFLLCQLRRKKDKNLEKLYEIFKFTREQKVPVSTIGYAAAVQALFELGRTDEGAKLLALLNSSGVLEKSDSRYHIIRSAMFGCVKASRYEVAIGLLNKGVSYGMSMNIAMISAFYSCLLALRKWDAAVEMHKRALSEGIYNPWADLIDLKADFHGLSAPTAKVALWSILSTELAPQSFEKTKSMCSRIGKLTSGLVVVTGRGNNSENNIAVLFPEICRMLQSEMDPPLKFKVLNKEGAVKISAKDYANWYELWQNKGSPVPRSEDSAQTAQE